MAASTSAASTEKTRETAVLEHVPVRLALGAVVDRVLLEVDAGERRLAAPARLTELVVDAIGLRVVRAGEPQLEAACELVADRVGQPLDLLIGDLRRERVGR